MMNRCDVCKKETETTVCCSACGAISFAYCDTCLEGGIEPYSALVGMGMYYADINETFKYVILEPSLRFYNKTVEQFNSDVKQLDDDYAEYCRECATTNIDEEF
jgi:hypothetical protein